MGLATASPLLQTLGSFMDNQDELECCTHGKAIATYVCKHLIEGTNKEWHCREPDEETPWPDSWCGICHQHFISEGEWNEISEAAAEISENIKLLCNQCYEHRQISCNVHYI